MQLGELALLALTSEALIEGDSLSLANVSERDWNLQIGELALQ